MGIFADVFNTVFTYRVEIRHTTDATDDGRTDWTHIHGLDWETTESFGDAMVYAKAVVADHPGSQVRIVETGDGYDPHHIPVT